MILNGIYVFNVLVDDGGNFIGWGIVEIIVGLIMDNFLIFVNSIFVNVFIFENSLNG